MTQSEFRKYIKGKKIDILGIGVSNKPLIPWLAEMGAVVTARDKNELPEAIGLGAAKTVFGENYLENLDGDIIFRTPGLRFDLPQIAAAVARGAVLTSETEMLFELCPSPITAVTGSDGKTTTTTIIYEFLKRSGRKVWLGGNIGSPLCHRVFEMEKSDEVVLELSSFQLHTMKKSPHIAVITNIAPNHLDKHKDYREYIDAKKNIFLYQSPEDRLVINADNAVTAPFETEASGDVKPFCYSGKNTLGIWLDKDGVIRDGGEKILDRRDIKLPGDHNVENYMAAIAAVGDKVGKEVIVSTAKSFGGVRHRLELVDEIDGVKYYNDSIGTSPSRSAAGLRSFDKKPILIAGGYDKHLDYTEFGKIVAERVKLLITTGNTAPKITEAVRSAAPDFPIIHCEEFDDTVKTASENAKSGDIVLLSPASASFDHFKNFEERGDRFVSLVKNIKK